MKRTFDPPQFDRPDTWTAPDVTVDDLNAYAKTGHRFGFSWWERATFRLAARLLARFDRSHRQ